LDEQHLRLPLSWGFIGRVRATVSEALRSQPADVRDAAVMVASELAENVIKYGEALDGDDCGYVSLAASETSIVIRTMNGVSSAARAAAVMDRIAALDLDRRRLGTRSSGGAHHDDVPDRRSNRPARRR
jgi:anti-sigma regulatory factor (Ser/Thr protein kinase)